MSDQHSPTSPLLAGLPSPEFLEQLNHTSSDTRSSSLRHKDRRDSSYGGISSRELAKMLVAEEQECTNLRKMLGMLTSQLREETQRADDADRRSKDVVVRLKGVMEAKLVVEQDAARVAEELRLYKIQLENAQKEIYKAQSVLNDVDSQRVEAEEAAARARDTARKLKEQRLIDIAREDGRRMGIKEGLARGQDVGYRQGRAAGYAQGRVVGSGATLEEVEDDDDYYDGGNSTSSGGPSRPPSPPKSATPPSSRSRSTHKSRPTNYTDTVDNVSMPVPIAHAAAQPMPPPPVIKVESPPPPIVRPVQKRRTMPSPSTSQIHSKMSIPPDGWIPVLDEDGGIRLPPPHELSPQPSPAPSPSTTAQQPLPPPPILEDEPPLMMRPPEPHVSDQESVSSASPPRRPKHIRRRSSDSAASTTISQLDIVSPPNARTAQARERTLSAITEERSSAVPSPDPSYIQSLHNSSPRQKYRSTDTLHPPPSVSGPSLHKSASSSSEEYGFDVVPPSRPTSRTYTPEPVNVSTNLLSAEDANNRPITPKPVEEPPLPPPTPISQLPPGFVPFTPGGSTIGPAGVPLPPSTVGTVRTQLAPTPGYSFHNIPGGRVVEEPDTEPVIPIPSRSMKSFSARSATSTAQSRRPASTDSDDEVSSSLGSDDSLTTPPRGKLSLYSATPGAGAAGVPLPPSTVAGSGRTATRVPLPPSTVSGTPKSTRSRTTAGGGRLR